MAIPLRSRSYLFLAAGLAAFTLAGFARTFYLRHWFNVPPISQLLFVHGLVFSAWFALFVVQVRLISGRNIASHQRLGVAGVVLAALVVFTGMAVAIASAHSPRPRFMGLTSPQFAILPVVAIVSFGGLVTAAILFRRKPQIHRRLMMLAMVSVLGPPAARLLNLAGMREHFLAIQTGVAAAFVLWCLLADWKRHRTLHPIYTVGGTLIVLSWPLRVWLATTPAWQAVGNWMASLDL